MSATATSTPRLSEYAKSFVFPAGICRTVWPRVEAKGREIGLGFDWWQSQSGAVILGYRDDGRYAATVGGVGMSIPRQVGKTYFVLAMLVVMCILFPGLQVVWTAHHLRTSTKTFTALRGICRRPKVAPFIRSIRAANGEQQVEFVNGSMFYFGARAQGFGRGFDEIDVEVFDEAQILDTKALEDMIAATNQARHEHGALLFFMGTPPRPSDPSEAFRERRDEALAGESEDAVWLEIGADPGSDVNDETQWPLMNPSYPLRTPRESMLRLRRNLKDNDSWNREGRGVWDAEAHVKRVADPDAWKALCTPAALPEWPLAAVGLDMDLSGRLWASVAAHAGETGTHLELLPENLLAAGQDAAVAWLWERCKRRLPVVMPAESGARVLQAPLLAKGVKVYALNGPEIAQMSASLAQGVKDKTISHLADALLQAAVESSERADGKTGQWRIQRAGEANGAPLLAVASAHFGAVKWSKRRTGERRGRQSRKAVRA